MWPDILCLGKGMSAGYAPLSAVVLSRPIADAFWGEPADLVQFHSGHTYGANPVACAIGLAAIGQLHDEQIPERSAEAGERLVAALRHVAQGVPGIGIVRGRGLLVGVELVADPATRARFPASLGMGTRVREIARQHGLLLRASHWMVVLAPPLTLTDAELDEVAGITGRALEQVLGPVARAPGAGRDAAGRTG